jgi:hypothetical protein
MKKAIAILGLAVSLFAETPSYPQDWNESVNQFGNAVIEMSDGDRKEMFVEQFKYYKQLDTTDRSDSWYESMFVVVLNAETSCKTSR